MTRRLCLFIALALLACPAAAEDKSTVIEIDVSDIQAGLSEGKVKMPTVINDAKELAKVFTNENVREQIGKAVDFEKQKLVYFVWSGSGQDKLTHTVQKAEKGEKGESVKFQHRPGLTRDLRGHHKLFALAKDAKFTVESGR